MYLCRLISLSNPNYNNYIMKNHFFTLFAAAAIILGSCNGNGSRVTTLSNEIDSVSYAIGVSFGNQLKMSGMEEVNTSILASAMKDLFDGEEPIFDEVEANMILNKYFNMLHYSYNLEEGEQFLEENKMRDEVVTTESGLQYIVLEEGSGPKPGYEDEVVVHYTGTLIDGSVFDSSHDRGEPAQFRLANVIEGWTEVLQLMPVGSKWKVFIPQELAYGANPRQGGAIEPFMMLIFEIELIDIVED